MEDKAIIKALAIKLGTQDLESLRKEVSTMKFIEAYMKLGGYNIHLTDGEEFFDVNYKNISTTIYRTKRGNCKVSDKVDVWLSELSSRIITTTINWD